MLRKRKVEINTNKKEEIVIKQDTRDASTAINEKMIRYANL